MKKIVLVLFILTSINSVSQIKKISAKLTQDHVFYVSNLLNKYNESALTKDEIVEVLKKGTNIRNKEYWEVKTHEGQIGYLPIKNISNHNLLEFNNGRDELSVATIVKKTFFKPKDSLAIIDRYLYRIYSSPSMDNTISHDLKEKDTVIYLGKGKENHSTYVKLKYQDKIVYVSSGDVILLNETNEKGKEYKLEEDVDICVFEGYGNDLNLKKIKAGEKINIIGRKSRYNYGNTEYLKINYKGFENYINLKKHPILNKYILVNNCHYYKNETDDFTGRKKKYTEIYNISNTSLYSDNGVGVELRKLDNSKYIWFHLNRDLGCVTSSKYDRSYVKIKLENSQIVSFYHFGDIDCGKFSIVAKLTKSDIYKLKKSPIKTIRFQGSDYYHDEKNIEWKTFFKDKLNCIQ